MCDNVYLTFNWFMVPAKTDVIDYALRYIFRYPKTKKELIIQLRKKKYTESEIEKALRYLKRKWYLNDKQFAKDYIDFHCVRRGKPIIWVKQKLFEKWVDKEIIQEVIEKKIDDINKGIWKKIKKEIEQYKAKGLDWLEILEKLTRKGYTYNQIKKVIDSQDSVT